MSTDDRRPTDAESKLVEPPTATRTDPQPGGAESDALERAGTHPLGTAAGGIGGAIAGAVAGIAAGPVGSLAGAIGGAIAGTAIGTGSVATGPIEGPGVAADRRLGEVPCGNCGGTGRTGSAPCQECRGSGKVQRVVAGGDETALRR